MRVHASILAVLATTFATSCGPSTSPPGSNAPSDDASTPHDTSTNDSSLPSNDTSSSDTATPGDAPLADELVVQEWGTYTSVQASDGHPLGGVHHEDEPLPTWVHRRNFNDRSNYYFEQLPEEPTQQLETPVLYFWSKSKRAVKVRVDFPKGVVGEWFPGAASYVPAIGSVTAVANGSMTWDLVVDPAIDPATFQKVQPTEIWAPSRNVKSTAVSVAGKSGLPDENEQFLFYRGLGTFAPEVIVTETDDGRMHVKNGSSTALPSVFVLRVLGSTGEIVRLGALGAGATLDVTPPPGTKPLADYVNDARTMLAASLVESGLAQDVARAMVDTWTRSWFKNVGLRVLYVAPRAWTDAWLPTTIEPAPSSITRTLVGRIESITTADESALVASVKQAAQRQAPFDLSTLGRFAEPRASTSRRSAASRSLAFVARSKR